MFRAVSAGGLDLDDVEKAGDGRFDPGLLQQLAERRPLRRLTVFELAARQALDAAQGRVRSLDEQHRTGVKHGDAGAVAKRRRDGIWSERHSGSSLAAAGAAVSLS